MHADAGVIGAGALGFSAAYHLTRLGAGEVVLIDQYEPGAQVSPKAAGLLKSIQARETKTRLSRLAREIVSGFEQDPMAMNPAAEPGFTIDRVPTDPRATDRFVNTMKSEIAALDGASAQEERAGLFTMTADGRLMAGPSDQVRGFWVATGCNGSGFSLSSAIGRVIAEWIVGGEPPFDMSLLDPNRFNRHGMTGEQLLADTTWQYANYYTPPATH